jgi:hypothetical protein
VEEKEEALELNSQLDLMKEHITERDRIRSEYAETDAAINIEKKEGMKKINDMERDKIYAIKTLNEEMDFKVKETQANLMALNDEQL